MNHAQHCDELDLEIDRFADGLGAADPASSVPSCPEWTVQDLTRHLGTVHRWATLLVSRRSPTRLPRSEDESDRDLVGPEWLRRGGRELVATLRAAEPDDPMWAWGADQHVRFWSRRQLHETFVHRLDLELATQTHSDIDPAIALDAVDEFLTNMTSDGDIALRARKGRHAELFRIRSTQPEASWSVRLERDGYGFLEPAGDPDAELAGPAESVLKVLLGRGTLSQAEVVVLGDATLVEHWLSQTAFL